MCGIFGAYTTAGSLDIDRCFRATQALAHRGPDGYGVSLARGESRSMQFLLNPSTEEIVESGGDDTTLFLGHRRLSILDLAENAFQPMTHGDGSVWVVFNGEIYNHAELRAELIAKGEEFATDHSDTEALVVGWSRWGTELIPRLRGMFAFALIDLRRRVACLARDAFGKKPLYVRHDRSGFVFASELKAFTEGGFSDRTIDACALRDYLRFGYVPSPSTIYTDVAKLRPAEWVLLDLDRPERLERSRYWKLNHDADPDFLSSDDWNDRFRHHFREAVRPRLLSDVPLGGFLSGGIDSTAVVREMSHLLPDRPKAFTIAFEESAHDESRFARQAAERYGLDHRVRTVRADDLLQLLPRLARIFDEPFADSSALPSLALADLTRDDVTVALSGDGGDELLGGYTRYRWNLTLSRWFDSAAGSLLAKLLAPAVRLWPDSVRGKGLVQLFRSGERDRYEALISDRYLLERSALADGASMDFGEVWDGSQPTLLDRMTTTDIEFYVPEDLMVKLDRTSMDRSLEVRTPILDRRLFEFVAGTPLALRYDDARPKLPLQLPLESDLGRPFVQRSKHGFSVPLARWFRGPLDEQLQDALGERNGLINALYPGSTVRDLLRRHRDGTRDQSARIWKLWMLAQWHSVYGGTL